MRTHKARYYLMSFIPLLVPTSVLAADRSATLDPIGRLKAQIRMLRADIESKNARIAELNCQIRDMKANHLSQVGRFRKEITALRAKFERLGMMHRNATGKAQTQPAKTHTDKAPPKKAKRPEKAPPKDVPLKGRTQPAGAGGTGLTARGKALYEKYKNKYAYIDGEYVPLPDFDLSYKSSRKDTPLPRSLAYMRVSPHKKVPRSEEQLAVLRERWHASLPFLGIGQFGRIDSFQAYRILGPDDMIVHNTKRYWGRKLWRERLIRVKGFPTAGLNTIQSVGRIEGAAIEIGIIGSYRYSRPEGRALNITHALPMGVIRKGLTERQFEAMLMRGIDPEASTTRPAGGGR